VDTRSRKAGRKESLITPHSCNYFGRSTRTTAARGNLLQIQAQLGGGELLKPLEMEPAPGVSGREGRPICHCVRYLIYFLLQVKCHTNVTQMCGIFPVLHRPFALAFRKPRANYPVTLDQAWNSQHP
jgi:hypothetical protein